MAEILNNLVYLTDNLTNLSKILLHLTEQGILSENEGEEIKNEKTSLERNTKLLNLIRKKDWENIKEVFLRILRGTGNGHCASKLEHFAADQIIMETQRTELSTNESIAMDVPKNKMATRENYEEDIDNGKTCVESAKSWKKWSYKRTIFTIAILVAAIIAVVVGISFILMTENPQVLDQQKLERLVKENKWEKAVQLARIIHGRVNSSISLYNLAVCLEHSGELAEAATIIEKMFATGKNSSKSSNQMKMTQEEMRKATEIEMKIIEKFILKIVVQLDFTGNPKEKNIRLFLLKLYFRLGRNEEIKRIVEQTASVNQIMELLSLIDPPSYELQVNGYKMDFKIPLGQEIRKIKIMDFSVDVSLLPPSLQTLHLARTELVFSERMDLPNLKYLFLEEMSNSSSFIIQLPQLTHIEFSKMKEVNLDLIPQNVKNIKISLGLFSTRIIGGLKKLSNLILEGFPLDQVETTLRHFRTKQLVIYDDYAGYEPTPQLISFINSEQIETIAVAINWTNKLIKSSSIFSNQVDRQSKHYLVERGRGKAIEEEHFEKLRKLW